MKSQLLKKPLPNHETTTRTLLTLKNPSFLNRVILHVQWGHHRRCSVWLQVWQYGMVVSGLQGHCHSLNCLAISMLYMRSSVAFFIPVENHDQTQLSRRIGICIKPGAEFTENFSSWLEGFSCVCLDLLQEHLKQFKSELNILSANPRI